MANKRNARDVKKTMQGTATKGKAGFKGREGERGEGEIREGKGEPKHATIKQGKARQSQSLAQKQDKARHRQNKARQARHRQSKARPGKINARQHTTQRKARKNQSKTAT